MTNNYNAMPDGSLVFDQPFDCRSQFFALDPADPRIAVPKVPACADRRIAMRTLSCGRTRSDWSCAQNVPNVSARTCNECLHPRP